MHETNVAVDLSGFQNLTGLDLCKSYEAQWLTCELPKPKGVGLQEQTALAERLEIFPGPSA